MEGAISVGMFERNVMPSVVPTGLGFDVNLSKANGTDNLSLFVDEWRREDKRRIFFGNIARTRILLSIRATTGILLATYCLMGVLLPNKLFGNAAITLIIWTPIVSLATVPFLLAVESAIKTFDTRASLVESGALFGGRKHAIRSAPGMDRIKESLRDIRKQNILSIILNGTALLLLSLTVTTNQSSLRWNFLLLVSMTLGLSSFFHAAFTSELILQLGDEFPLLAYHTPTHHPSILSSLLGDLVKVHLDPDLTLEWMAWEDELAKMTKKGVRPRQARERLLYLLLLEARGAISFEDVFVNINEFLKGKFVEESLNSKGTFDLFNLQRLIEHAIAWQPGVFKLLDRLQNDLLSSADSVSLSDWRMDLTLEPTCIGGVGNLFIAVNNLSNKDMAAKVEVIVPGGEPESSNHGFVVNPSPGPEKPLELISSDEEDVVDWMPKFLDNGIILWSTLAWKKGVRGRCEAQVILRDELGGVIQSQTVSTYVKDGTGSAIGNRRKAIQNARVGAAKRRSIRNG